MTTQVCTDVSLEATKIANTAIGDGWPESKSANVSVFVGHLHDWSASSQLADLPTLPPDLAAAAAANKQSCNSNELTLSPSNDSPQL